MRNSLLRIIPCLGIIALVSCGTHKPDWPQQVWDGIWIPKGAQITRYAHEGIYKVFYNIDVCYPANGLIEEMANVMTAKGWVRLTFDPLREPEKVPLSHARAPGDQWGRGLDMDYGEVYGWKDAWWDNKRNVVAYTFKYKPGNGQSIENTCSLTAYSSYTSEEDLQALLKLFRETPVVIPEKEGGKGSPTDIGHRPN